eukprot:7190262-Prymnesium_polylepis.1
MICDTRDGDRTRGHEIKSLALYQLSYASSAAKVYRGDINLELEPRINPFDERPEARFETRLSLTFVLFPGW